MPVLENSSSTTQSWCWYTINMKGTVSRLILDNYYFKKKFNKNKPDPKLNTFGDAVTIREPWSLAPGYSLMQ